MERKVADERQIAYEMRDMIVQWQGTKTGNPNVRARITRVPVSKQSQSGW